MKKKIVGILCVTLTASMILSHTQPLKATNIQEEQKKQEDLKKNIESATQILSELILARGYAKDDFSECHLDRTELIPEAV